MGRHRRAWAVAIAVVAIAVLGTVAYLGAGVVLYDGLSKVSQHCGMRADGNGRFADVTPANLGYSTKDFGDGDLAASFVLNKDLTAYRMPEYQEITFPSRPSDGVPAATLRGWWIPGSTADAPTVILVHGRDACRKDWNVLLPAAMLHKAGFATLLFDMRNHGESDLTVGATAGRYYAGVVEHLDVLGAWDWVRAQKGVPAERIGVMGASLGAGSAIIAAAEEPRVAAVWEDSSYADTRQRAAEEIEERYKLPLGFVAPAGGIISSTLAGVDIYSKTPLQEIAKLAGRPIAIVHGAADASTLPHHARDLYEAAGRAGVPAQLWIVPYAAHTWGVIADWAGYESRMVTFFRDHLGSGA